MASFYCLCEHWVLLCNWGPHGPPIGFQARLGRQGDSFSVCVPRRGLKFYFENNSHFCLS